MKKILYILSILFTAWAVTGCSEETFEGANPNLIPNADDINATISVDPETNQVTLTLNNPGCYPIWSLNKGSKTVKSTVNGYNDIITLAGEYTVEVKMGNKHGICQGSKTLTFTIDKSIVDWTPYVTFLNGGEGSAKRWEMARNEKGHLGCGEPGTDGLNWWSAGPGEKNGTGMYEAIMQFTDKGAPNGEYVLDPTEGGQIYCNKDVTAAPYGDYNTNDGNDYSFPFELRTSTYNLALEGTDLYLELPQGQCLPYLPNHDVLDNPRYRVLSLTRNKMELVCDNGGISWHYIFVPEGTSAEAGGDEPGQGDDTAWVDANSAANLMNAGALELASCWWADNNWGQIADPDVEINGRTIKITANADNGSQKWQGQVHVNTGIAIEEGKTYSFKMVLNPNQDGIGATVKPHPEGDDDHFFTEDQNPINGYEDNEVKVVNFTSNFATDNLVITLDFTNVKAGTVIEVKEIILQKEISWVDANSADNLMNSGVIELASCWWADNNWGQIADPDVEINGRTVNITANADNGSQKWQGQVHLNTGIAIEEGRSYSFKMVLNPNQDGIAATVKPHPEGDDGHFFTEDQNPINGYEDNEMKVVNFVADFATSNLVITLDFTGVKAGTVISVKEIILQAND